MKKYILILGMLSTCFIFTNIASFAGGGWDDLDLNKAHQQGKKGANVGNTVGSTVGRELGERQGSLTGGVSGSIVGGAVTSGGGQAVQLGAVYTGGRFGENIGSTIGGTVGSIEGGTVGSIEGGTIGATVGYVTGFVNSVVEDIKK